MSWEQAKAEIAAGAGFNQWGFGPGFVSDWNHLCSVVEALSQRVEALEQRLATGDESGE